MKDVLNLDAMRNTGRVGREELIKRINTLSDEVERLRMILKAWGEMRSEEIHGLRPPLPTDKAEAKAEWEEEEGAEAEAKVVI